MQSPTDPDTTIKKYQIADWCFYTDLHQLERGEKQVRLEPRVAQLLLYLVRNPGTPASREELMEAVWPNSVVGDEALNNAINKLRRAFEDDRQNPRIIETLPKIGYRLIAPVNHASQDNETQLETTATAVAIGSTKRPIAIFMVIIGFVLIGVISWFVYFSELDENDGIFPDTGMFAENSIAVLPFENLNHDPAQDYFADGMSDDLITELSKIPGLLVISRSSSYAYRDKSDDIRQIAQALNAGLIIEGSVRRENDKIRINAQLVDANTGHHLWADRFDGFSDQVFDLQDQITRQVVTVLESRLQTPGIVSVQVKPTTSLAAYDLFLQGSGIFQRFSKGDTFKSRRYFEQAIDLDPDFSDAYAMLAWTHVFEYMNGWSQTPQATLEQALKLANKSITIGKRSAVAHFVKGLVYRERKEFDIALTEAKRLLEVEPSYANGYVLMATILYYTGKPQEGLDMLGTASRLNPIHPSNYPFHKGQALFILQRYDEAIEAFKSGLNQNPTSQRLRVWLAATYAQIGLIDEATWEANEILSEDPDFSPVNLETIFPFQNSEDLNRFNSALKKAGFRNLSNNQNY